MILAVTGLGICAPEGLRAHPPLAALPGGDQAGVVDGPVLRPWLKRRKDRKLLARASALSLVAAGEALGDWPGDRSELGLFWGVGREPPDDGECEAALAAACEQGRLSPVLLADRGRDLYPPLLPLKTLPNLALAHVSINLGIGGENGAWTGGAEAGLQAILAGYWAVCEGRAPAALVGAGDSQVDLGSARDRLRLGKSGAPGEAAAALLLEPLDVAYKRAARITCLLEPEPRGERPGEGIRHVREHRDRLGDCGAADGALAVILAALDSREQGRNISIRLGTESREGVSIRLRKPGPC